jgi:hypothetical protein
MTIKMLSSIGGWSFNFTHLINIIQVYCMFWQHTLLLTQVKPLKSYYFLSLCDDSNFLVLFLQIAGTVLALSQLLFATLPITIG